MIWEPLFLGFAKGLGASDYLSVVLKKAIPVCAKTFFRPPLLQAIYPSLPDPSDLYYNATASFLGEFASVLGILLFICVES